MAELREGDQARGREEADGRGSPRAARAVLQGQADLLEARRPRRRPGLRRRRHRPLYGPQRRVPRGHRLPHGPHQPARRLVLQLEGAAHALRHLGQARLGPAQRARLHRRLRAARDDLRAARGLLHGLLERRLGPRRLLLRHADPLLLQRHGALRVRLLRHDGALPRPDHDLPGRAAPPGLPLQVQDQDRRLPERLRGLDRPLRPLHPGHLEGRDPDRPGRGARPTPRPAWTSMPRSPRCARPPA